MVSFVSGSWVFFPIDLLVLITNNQIQGQQQFASARDSLHISYEEGHFRMKIISW